jgi:hypothetical protein
VLHVAEQQAYDGKRQSRAESHCCDFNIATKLSIKSVGQKTLIMLTKSDVQNDFQVFVAWCSGGGMLSYFHAMLDRLRSETKEQGQAEV